MRCVGSFVKGVEQRPCDAFLSNRLRKHDESMKRFLLSGILLALLVSGAAARELHVAPQGQDGNPGTKTEPLASLDRARVVARDGDESTTVWLHDGVYMLQETVAFASEDGGTESVPIHYRAVNPGKVRLSGGVGLDPESFQPVGDDDRLVDAARKKVFRLSLDELGAGALGKFPDQFRTAQALPELFFNGERMTLAQWPNAGWATIDTVVESGAAPWRKHASDALGVFTYTGEEPSRWANVEDVWVEGYWCFDWASETIRVASVDPAKREIALAKPHVYGLGSGNPAPRRFRAVNLLEELDSAGEYFIDRHAQALYFWPPASLDGAEVTLSLLSKPLLALEDVSHVTFSGLVLEDCAGTAMTVKGGSHVTVAGCEIRNAGLQGIVVDGGLHHVIQSCDIHHNGTGGIQIAGGDRKTLSPSGHRVVNNHIYRVSERMRTSAYNLRVNGVGVYVAHNEINDAPHQAIGWGGNDHIFELNNVHHVSMNSDDCGAFYMGRDPSHRGSIIRHNYWHHIGSEMAHGSCAIYFDDGDGGQVVTGNVFYKASGGNFGAVFNHGGHDNQVTNNIFIDCEQAIGSAPWSDGNWAKWQQEPLWQKRLREDVDITQPPYTDRYPELKDFYTYDGLRMNHASGNVAVRCKNYVEGNWVVEKSLVTQEDPGFVDLSKENFALRDDAPLYQWLPGFQPIPFEKMGLYVDAHRTSLSE